MLLSSQEFTEQPIKSTVAICFDFKECGESAMVSENRAGQGGRFISLFVALISQIVNL